MGHGDDQSKSPAPSVGALLDTLSEELDPSACSDLSELGIYSIHDHQTVEKLTVPADADQFDDVTTVKQYYYEGENCPLLLVAPIDP